MSAIVSSKERKEQIRWVDDSSRTYTCNGIRKNKMVLFGVREGIKHSRHREGVWRTTRKKPRGCGFTENDKGEKNPEATQKCIKWKENLKGDAVRTTIQTGKAT